MRISALVLTIGVLTSLSLSSMAQDKAQLAKLEYEMAEASLAAKEYVAVNNHLNKAVEFLGKTNFKIEYLRLQHFLDMVNSYNGEGVQSNIMQFLAYQQAQSILKDYANTDNKEKYGEVYRTVANLEPKIKELKKEYDGLYVNYKSYHRAMDSLRFFKKESPFEQKKSLDTIWRLGRTYTAITSHYKNAIVKRLNAATTSGVGKEFITEIYNRTNFKTPVKYTIENLSLILPPTAEISHGGEVYIPYSASFNEDDRLFAIKYIHKNKRTGQFWQPVENTWSTKEHDGRYIATSSMVIEYFVNDKESGVLLVLPYSKLNGGDADGNNFKSYVINSSQPGIMAEGISYFNYVYGYNARLYLDGKDAEGAQKGMLITEVMEGGSAALAGLKVNDIITRLGYTRIYAYNQILDALLIYSPGEIIEIDYYRDGSLHTTKATVGR
jgi:hypothetical protein